VLCGRVLELYNNQVQKNYNILLIKERHWSILKRWKLMNMNWCSLKTNCTI